MLYLVLTLNVPLAFDLFKRTVRPLRRFVISDGLLCSEVLDKNRHIILHQRQTYQAFLSVAV